MVEQGSYYISQELKGNLEAADINLVEAPIENPGTIGIVERYQAPLRAAYEILRADFDRKTSDDECLRMAVYSVNATVGPEGLCPIILVFCVMPRPARTN